MSGAVLVLMLLPLQAGIWNHLKEIMQGGVTQTSHTINFKLFILYFSSGSCLSQGHSGGQQEVVQRLL